MIIDLTVAEIIDLAVGAGLQLDPNIPTERYDPDVVVCITKCPAEGVTDDDGTVEHYDLIMYFEDCPEETVIPLGDPKP